jgi:four helix bundle protein
MKDQSFDHEKLDVYRLSLAYVADTFRIAQGLTGVFRHSRDQWLRASQSIPLNIAEGNGKRSLKDRSRFLDIARGSALECAAIQDVLVVSNGVDVESSNVMKDKLRRIVAMLTRLIQRSDVVSPTTEGIDR